MTPRLYHVQTTHGPIKLYAITQAQAFSSALELAGPGARVVRLWRKGSGDQRSQSIRIGFGFFPPPLPVPVP